MLETTATCQPTVEVPRAQLSGKRRAPPLRVPNAARRHREYLTPEEVGRLLKAAGTVGRCGHRDATLILIAYRHALRVSELCALRWSQVDLRQGLLHVVRRKGGTNSTHPLHGPELRALRRLQADQGSNPYVFVTERGTPLSTSGVRKIVARAGELAKIGIPIHPHMLRHSLGYKLVNDQQSLRAIQHYMGHRSPVSTALYTSLAPGAFEGFWND